MSLISRPGSWIRHHPSRMARQAYGLAQRLRKASLPPIPLLHASLYVLHRTVMQAWRAMVTFFYWTPLFNSRLAAPAKNLRLYSGMPLVLGPLQIHIDEDCRISGVTTLSGRWASKEAPQLIVGKNCDIGHMTNISIGTKVVLGNNVRIAARCYLAGYPGHPLDVQDRAKGMACKDDQARPITLEDDVWLGTNVFVIAGVTIGRGSVIAAGSVVTKDIPANVIAGGNPARIIRRLDGKAGAA